jgi:hypothetical protein
VWLACSIVAFALVMADVAGAGGVVSAGAGAGGVVSAGAGAGGVVSTGAGGVVFGGAPAGAGPTVFGSKGTGEGLIEGVTEILGEAVGECVALAVGAPDMPVTTTALALPLGCRRPVDIAMTAQASATAPTTVPDQMRSFRGVITRPYQGRLWPQVGHSPSNRHI